MHSDRMSTDAISESMIQVLYCRAVYGGAVIPDSLYMSNSRQNMYILDYNENSTAQYMYKQALKQAVSNTVHFTT